MSSDLPYLNVNDEQSITLKTLFDYQELKIPAINGGDKPDENFYILNIKKQFICVIKEGENSEIYVKRQTIGQPLELINNSEKPMQGKIKFSHGQNPQGYNENETENNDEAKTYFDAVYIKIQKGEMPKFNLVASESSSGGIKGGRTRKRGGSRSR